MVSWPREEFSTELGAAVVTKASTLLAAVGTTSLQPSELLSVRRAWFTMDHTKWKDQQRVAPILALVKALQLAYGDARGASLWPTPEEHEERRRARMRRGDSCIAPTITAGVVSPGAMAPWVVDATVEVAAEKIGVATPTTTAGATSVAEAEQARLGLTVARDAVKGPASVEATGVVTAALGEIVDGGMAREAVPTGTARRPPSARPLLRARTTARRPWWRRKGKSLIPSCMWHPLPRG